MTKKVHDLDKFGYCVHLSTGYFLGDMCESCCDRREKQLDYRIWNIIFKLPKGYKLFSFYNNIRGRK